MYRSRMPPTRSIPGRGSESRQASTFGTSVSIGTAGGGRSRSVRSHPAHWLVLLLGDSVAFSSFWVSDNATVAGYLQALLARATSRPSEVLNKAPPGGFSEVSLATLAHEGTGFEPDVVVWLGGNNESPRRGRSPARGILSWTAFGGTRRQPFASQLAGPSLTIARLYDPRTAQGDAIIQFALLMRQSTFYRWPTSRRPAGVWADYPSDSRLSSAPRAP